MRFIGLAGVVFGMGALASTQASAAVIVEIDVSNPTAVKFTSTAAASSVTHTEQGAGTLYENFFPNIGNNSFHLGAGNFRSFVDNRPYTGATRQSLTQNMIVTGGNVQQTFTQGVRAFNGESIYNLGSPLPPAGQTGDIFVRSSFGVNTGLVIGQYVVVPEPATGLVSGGVALLALRRRRNHG